MKTLHISSLQMDNLNILSGLCEKVHASMVYVENWDVPKFEQAL